MLEVRMLKPGSPHGSSSSDKDRDGSFSKPELTTDANERLRNTFFDISLVPNTERTASKTKIPCTNFYKHSFSNCLVITSINT